MLRRPKDAVPVVLLVCLAASGALAQQRPAALRDLQDRCARQVGKIFYEQGYKDSTVTRLKGDEPGDWRVTASYESHYDAKLNRCFMLLATEGMGTSNLHFQSRSLVDISERRSYADYLWTPVEGKVDWQTSPFLCRLTPDHAEESGCTTLTEFQAFVDRYMQ
jgi:hypothetical protein